MRGAKLEKIYLLRVRVSQSFFRKTRPAAESDFFLGEAYLGQCKKWDFVSLLKPQVQIGEDKTAVLKR